MAKPFACIYYVYPFSVMLFGVMYIVDASCAYSGFIKLDMLRKRAEKVPTGSVSSV